MKDFIKGFKKGLQCVLKTIAESNYQYTLYGLEKMDRMFFTPMR